MRVERRAAPGDPAGPVASGGPRPTVGTFAQVLGRSGRTPLDGREALGHIAEAWRRVTGGPASAGTAAVLWAQWAHETARGRSMWGNNFAGLKGTGPSGGSMRLRTREGHGPAERATVDRFRAYASPAEGADDWLQTLRDRHPRAFAAAERGDPGAFVRALAAGGWFTGEVAAYERSVALLAREAIGLAGPPEVAADRAGAANDPPAAGPWVGGVLEAFSRAVAHRGDAGAD